MRTVSSVLGMVMVWATAVGGDGMISITSAHDVADTADRLEAALAQKGMTVFARVDHAAGARKAGQELRPTVLVIFGNPKVGTPPMNCAQSVGLDLPQKALIWEDETGQVWFTYNDPAYLAARHGLGECGGVLAKVDQALANFARVATIPE